MRLAFVLLAIGASACVTERRTPEEVMSRTPPALESLKREIDSAAPNCTAPNGYDVRYSPDNPRRPQRLNVCPQVYPDILQDAGFEAVCRAMFDIDAVGAPLRIEARCEVENGYMYQSTPAAWVRLAEQSLAYASVRAVQNFRYNTLAEAPAGQARENLSVGTVFVLPGGDASTRRLPTPPPFQRAPPAPALPTDLASLVSG